MERRMLRRVAQYKAIDDQLHSEVQAQQHEAISRGPRCRCRDRNVAFSNSCRGSYWKVLRPLPFGFILFVWAKRNFFLVDQTGWTSTFVCVFFMHR